MPEQVRILPGRMAGCRRAGILPAGVYIDELTRTGVEHHTLICRGDAASAA